MSFDPTIQGTKNYIEARDGTKLGLWTTYADAAGTSPVDGTGGAPLSTFAVSTDSTMRGVTNFLWTHSAANRQGEGFSYDFSIDPSDKGKVLQCSFEYLISSGTYADNDMSVWIYDVTNAVLIQPAPYLIKNSGIIEKFAVEFQTSSNSTSYRLIIHTGSTSASAYTIKFDNFMLGPEAKLYGSAITDPVAYTPTFTGLGTVTGINFVSWREGANLLVKGTFTTGTPTATEARISLGFGGGDSNVTALSTLPTLSAAGTTEVTNFSSTVYKISALIEPSVSYITMGNQASTVGGLSKQNGNALFGASVTVSLLLKIPIQGWSSSQIMSSDASSRTVIFSGYVASNQALTANVTNLPLTSSKDSHAAWTGSTYVVPVPGDYQIAATLLANATGGTMQAYVNAAAVKQMMTINTTEYVSSAITLENLKAGDIVSFRSNATQTVAGVSTAFVSISRISGPSQIAASESVSALYTGAPPTGTLNGSLNNVTFGTKVKDSHNAMSGATYTVPVSGTYSISATVAIIGTRVLGSTDQLNILVNGASIASNIQNAGGAIGTQYPLSSVLSYPILAGQTVTVQVATSSTTPSYDITATRAYFSIIRTGNY
jgi:hypothetical protein